MEKERMYPYVAKTDNERVVIIDYDESDIKNIKQLKNKYDRECETKYAIVNDDNYGIHLLILIDFVIGTLIIWLLNCIGLCVIKRNFALLENAVFGILVILVILFVFCDIKIRKMSQKCKASTLVSFELELLLNGLNSKTKSHNEYNIAEIQDGRFVTLYDNADKRKSSANIIINTDNMIAGNNEDIYIKLKHFVTEDGYESYRWMAREIDRI